MTKPKTPKKPKTLTPRFIALLGKVSDRDIARRSGVHIFRIEQERRARNIPRFFILSRLEPHLSKLGKVPDRTLAKAAGVSVETVEKARLARGLKALPSASRPFPDHAIKLLGTLPDATLSRRIDVSVHQVSKARSERGIPMYVAPPPPSLTKQQLSLLGKAPDTVIGAMTGLPPQIVNRVRRERGIAAFRGRAPSSLPVREVKQFASNSEAAAELQVSVETAMLARHREVIRKTGENVQVALPNAAIRLLGTMMDRDLAKKVGCSARTIYRARTARGIPRAKRTGMVYKKAG